MPVVAAEMRKFSHTRYRVWALILHITSTVILVAVYVVYIMVAALMQKFTMWQNNQHQLINHLYPISFSLSLYLSL